MIEFMNYTDFTHSRIDVSTLYSPVDAVLLETTTEDIFDYETIKSSMFLRLMPLDKAIAQNIVAYPYGDFCATVNMIVSKIYEREKGPEWRVLNIITAKVTNDWLDTWGVTKETLFSDALEATRRYSIPRVEFDKLHNGDIENATLFVDDELYLAGAAVFLLPEVQDQVIATQKGKNFFVCPASTTDFSIHTEESIMAFGVEDMMDIMYGSFPIMKEKGVSRYLYYYDVEDRILKRYQGGSIQKSHEIQA